MVSSLYSLREQCSISCNEFSFRKEGIGSIRVKMHDGIVKELTNVWHVLTLKKDLISPSVLEENENKIVHEKDGLT